MSGIVGIVDFSKCTSSEFLMKMTNVLLHRGPDGGGNFFSKIY